MRAKHEVRAVHIFSAIPKSNKLPQQYMNNVPNRDSIFLSPTDPDEILKIIRSFKAKNSSGDDGISMNLLKQISESICVPIASLVNLSLERGIVPNAMKLAKVIPIYKGKCKESFTNYRPISLLSNISKILEKVVHKRLLSFLTRCGILYNSQCGFRPNCSTIDAITEFTANVIPALDNNDKCLSVFLDLSKAFDTINHEILLMKLKRYGIRGVALKWFRSYLNQRMQYVSFKGVHSKTGMVEYGVPQGSVLGPLLFILYSNDIPLSLTHSKAILFADDTTVFCTGSDLEKMYECINSDLDNLNDWFKANQLSVNPSKTKYILFTKRCGVDDQMHNLYIEGTILERVPCTKFLGLYIDEHLSWKQHIDHCKKKMSSGIYAMNMAKHILSINHLRTLYYSLVHPYATYGIRLWGNTYQKHTKKLEVLQKRALRVMTGSKYNDPSSPLFKCMHILKLKDIHNLHVEQFIYEFVNGMLPLPLLSIYECQSDTHEYNTRQSTGPRHMKAHTDLMHRSFLCKGPILWSKLDGNIKSSKTKTNFKIRATRRIMEDY